jgi:FAD:protein FMN transferase
VQGAVETVGALERGLSVFLADSELSRVNDRAASGPVSVSADLSAVLNESLRIHGLTEGAFDPTVGPLMAAWGFRGGRPSVRPAREALRAALERTGLRRVRLGRQGVSYDAFGLALDLGGIGKGYAADRAADVLHAAGVRGLVNAGGDLRAAGPQPDGGPWWIGVRNPVRTGEILASLELAPGRGVATSGTYEQRYELEGGAVNHLLDPRSGEPVDGVLSATVVAPTSMEADALATAACVMGAGPALHLLRGLDGVEALLVAREGGRTRVEATSGLEVRILGRV